MPYQTLLVIISMLRVIESTNGTDPRANGNDLQITRICVRDVNRIYGTKYRYPDDVRDRRRSEEIAVLYLGYYVPRVKRLSMSNGMTDEEVAVRVWNGGPGKYWTVDRYWDKYKRLKLAK